MPNQAGFINLCSKDLTGSKRTISLLDNKLVESSTEKYGFWISTNESDILSYKTKKGTKSYLSNDVYTNTSVSDDSNGNLVNKAK